MEEITEYYYGLIDGTYGFLDTKTDPRYSEKFITLTEDEWNEVLEQQTEGKSIVCYDGKVFATDEKYRYYTDDNNEWQKRTDEELEELTVTQNKEYFTTNFFNTSLGWVRRTVTMSDGSKKNFLTDLYPSIAAAVNTGIEVPLLTYQEPDYTQELTTEYMETLQQKVTATAGFVTECATQLLADFQG